MRQNRAAGPLEEGVSDTTTTGEEEVVDIETEGAAAGALVGEAVGVEVAVGVEEWG